MSPASAPFGAWGTLGARRRRRLARALQASHKVVPAPLLGPLRVSGVCARGGGCRACPFGRGRGRECRAVFAGDRAADALFWRVPLRCAAQRACSGDFCHLVLRGRRCRVAAVPGRFGLRTSARRTQPLPRAIRGLRMLRRRRTAARAPHRTQDKAGKMERWPPITLSVWGRIRSIIQQSTWTIRPMASI